MYAKKRRAPAEKSADEQAARDRALDLLTGQDFSCAMLYERLRRRFTDEAAASAVAHVQRLQLADDARYARGRAAALLRRHQSRRAIAEDLRRKGIDRPLIEAALAELYPEEDPGTETPNAETEAAAQLVQSRYLRRLQEGRTDLVLAALARRGFRYGDAKAAVALACARSGLERRECPADDFAD